jgi:hypothetical protein
VTTTASLFLCTGGRVCRRYITQGRGLSPLSQGERQRTIYSLDCAHSRPSILSASDSSVSSRARHSHLLDYGLICSIFTEFRGPRAPINIFRWSSFQGLSHVHKPNSSGPRSASYRRQTREQLIRRGMTGFSVVSKIPSNLPGTRPTGDQLDTTKIQVRFCSG